MNSRLPLSKIVPRAVLVSLGCVALLAVTACEPPVVERVSSSDSGDGELHAPRMALFHTPTEGMFASWYAGYSLEELARIAFDAETLRGRGTDRALERHESFQIESAWLDGEVERRIIDPALRPRTHLFDEDDRTLMSAFPSRRDRFVLRTLLRAEFADLARDAALDEFARGAAQRSAADGALSQAGVRR